MLFGQQPVSAGSSPQPAPTFQFGQAAPAVPAAASFGFGQPKVLFGKPIEQASPPASFGAPDPASRQPAGFGAGRSFSPAQQEPESSAWPGQPSQPRHVAADSMQDAMQTSNRQAGVVSSRQRGLFGKDGSGVFGKRIADTGNKDSKPFPAAGGSERLKVLAQASRNKAAGRQFNPPAAVSAEDNDQEEQARKAARAARFSNQAQPAKTQSPSAPRVLARIGNAASPAPPQATHFGVAQAQQQWQAQDAMETMEETDGNRATTSSPALPNIAEAAAAFRGGTPTPDGGSMAGMDDDGMGDGNEGDAFVIVGTCETMCPAEERQRREVNAELHPLERVDPENPKQTDVSLIVKRAVRNYDTRDRRPELFRTLTALGLTMEHLRNVMDWTKADHPAAEPLSIHGFLWDRYREVRKELRTQRFHQDPATLPFVIAWNEEICRYLLVSGHELCGTNGFDYQLNQEQMNKCLMDILDFYRTAASMGVACPNSAEFKCYLVIMTYAGLVNKHRNKIPNKQAALELMRGMTPTELASPWYPVMLAVLQALSLTDVVTFWKLSMAAPYVLGCVLFTQMQMVQQHGMALAAKAYDATYDPNNCVPLSAVTPFVKLGHMAISGKARNLGAQVLSDSNGTEYRFAYLNTDEYRPNVVSGKLRPTPLLKREGKLYTVAANPPTLTSRFLKIIDRMAGRRPGTTRPTAGLPASLASLSPAAAQQAAAKRQSSLATSGSLQRPQGIPAIPAGGSLVAQPQGFQPSPTSRAAIQPPAAQPGSGIGFSTVQGNAFGTLQPAVAPSAGVGFPPSAAVKQEQPGSAVRRIPGHAEGFAQPFGALAAGDADAAVALANTEQALAKERAEKAAALSRVEAERREKEAIQQAALSQQQELHAYRQHFQQQAEHLTSTLQQRELQMQQQLTHQSQQLQALEQERQAMAQQLAKRLLKEQGERLQSELQRRLQIRALEQWYAAMQEMKDNEARVQEQLARCRIDMVAKGSPATSIASLSGRAGSTPVSSKRPCRRMDIDETAVAVSNLTPDLFHQHLPLKDILLPVLDGAVKAAKWKPLQHASSSPAELSAIQATSLWKLVVCIPTLQQPVSQATSSTASGQLYQAASDWLRAKLSAGRGACSYEPPSGSLLTYLPAERPSAYHSRHPQPIIDVSVQEVDAAVLAAKEPVTIPEHSSISMNATSGLLLLVPGVEDNSENNQNNRQRTGNALPSDVSAQLNNAWTHLRQLLEHTAPQVRIPAVVLALTNERGCESIASHFKQVASKWPVAVTSRLSSCQVLPLLPQQKAEGVLIQALCQLAAHPPAPFLIASGCPDTTPASNPNSPRWAATASGLLKNVTFPSGPPQRVSVQKLVKQVLESCLAQHEPPADHLMQLSGQHESTSSIAKDTIMSFNTSLEAVARGVQATASHVIAAWGMPAAEIQPTDPAPNCWKEHTVKAARDCILNARVPVDAAPSPAEHCSVRDAFRAVAALLHASHMQWCTKHVSSSAMYCHLLPRYLPDAKPIQTSSLVQSASTSSYDSITSNGFGQPNFQTNGHSSGALHGSPRLIQYSQSTSQTNSSVIVTNQGLIDAQGSPVAHRQLAYNYEMPILMGRYNGNFPAPSSTAFAGVVPAAPTPPVRHAHRSGSPAIKRPYDSMTSTKAADDSFSIEVPVWQTPANGHSYKFNSWSNTSLGVQGYQSAVLNEQPTEKQQESPTAGLLLNGNAHGRAATPSSWEELVDNLTPGIAKLETSSIATLHVKAEALAILQQLNQLMES